MIPTDAYREYIYRDLKRNPTDGLDKAKKPLKTANTKPKKG